MHIGDPLVLVAFAAVDGIMAVQQVAAAQAVDIVEEGFMVTWFGDRRNEKRPAVDFSTNGRLEYRPSASDNCRHRGDSGAEPLKHPVAGIDFAILLMVLAASVRHC